MWWLTYLIRTEQDENFRRDFKNLVSYRKIVGLYLYSYIIMTVYIAKNTVFKGGRL